METKKLIFFLLKKFYDLFISSLHLHIVSSTFKSKFLSQDFCRSSRLSEEQKISCCCSKKHIFSCKERLRFITKCLKIQIVRYFHNDIKVSICFFFSRNEKIVNQLGF